MQNVAQDRPPPMAATDIPCIVDLGGVASSPTILQHRKRPKRSKGLIPKGGVVASALNLTSATLGAGTLALPYAVQSAGVLVGVLFLVTCCIATVYSIRILVQIIDLTGYRTYEAMSRNLLGKRFEQLTAFLIFIFCWGIASAYVTAVGDLLSAFSDLDSFPEIFKGLWGRRFLSTLFWGCLMLPLSLAKEINSLRYASLVGMLCTNVVVAAVVYHTLTNAQSEESVAPFPGLGSTNTSTTTLLSVGSSILPQTTTNIMFKENQVRRHSFLPLVQLNLKAITALPIIIFAFCCQSNCFEIYGELKKRSVSRMTHISAYAMGLCTLIYIICGIAGAAEFGERTLGNILSNYRHPTEVPYIMFSFFCISLTITTSFPMCIFPMREAVLQSMGYANKNKDHNDSCSDSSMASMPKCAEKRCEEMREKDPVGVAIGTALASSGNDELPVETSKEEAPSYVRIPVAAVLSTMSVLVGLFAPEISVFFGLLGGICGSTLSFIWPALFMLKLEHNAEMHILAFRKGKEHSTEGATSESLEGMANKKLRKTKKKIQKDQTNRKKKIYISLETDERRPIQNQESLKLENTSVSSPAGALAGSRRKSGKRVSFKDVDPMPAPYPREKTESSVHSDPSISYGQERPYEADGDNLNQKMKGKKVETKLARPLDGDSEDDDEDETVVLTASPHLITSTNGQPSRFVLQRFERASVWALLIGGLFSGVFGTVVSIYVAFFSSD